MATKILAETFSVQRWYSYGEAVELGLGVDGDLHVTLADTAAAAIATAAAWCAIDDERNAEVWLNGQWRIWTPQIALDQGGPIALPAQAPGRYRYSEDRNAYFLIGPAVLGARPSPFPQ